MPPKGMPTHHCVVEELRFDEPLPRFADGTPSRAWLRVVCLEADWHGSGSVRDPLTAEQIDSALLNLRNWCPARHVLVGQ